MRAGWRRTRLQIYVGKDTREQFGQIAKQLKDKQMSVLDKVN
jgi:hypothetical protein